MEKLKTIEYELEQTEKRLEDLLAGIMQLKKEVNDMVSPKVKKVIHERVVLDRCQLDRYIRPQDYLRFWIGSGTYTLVNISRYKHLKKGFLKYKSYLYPHEKIELFNLNETIHSQVIITYIPSINTVYLIER